MKFLAKFSHAILLMMCVVVISCSNTPTKADKVKNEETTQLEKQIDGQWVAAEIDEGYEEGVLGSSKFVYKITYDSRTHKMREVVETYMNLPEAVLLLTTTFSGSWSAKDGELTENVDKNSFVFKFNDDVLSAADQAGIKESIMQQYSITTYQSDIVDISKNQMSLRNPDGVLIYSRM